MKNKYFFLVVLTVITLALLIAPLLTQGSLYFVGGDDTRMYYVYPRQYIQNLLLNIISDNTIGGANIGYYPATHPIPLITLIWVLKTLIPVNTQFLMYGLNWALAFVFFYLLLGLWIPNQTRIKFFIKVVASLFYVFSPFLIKTLYKHEVVVLYLICAAPGVLYFFIKSVREHNPWYVFTACLILSIFSTNLSSVPWSLPILITSLPILITVFFQSKKTFILHSLLFVLGYFLLNLSWIFHTIYITLNNTGLSSSLEMFSSSEFIKTNIQGILGTARLFSPLNAVINQLDIGLIKNISPISSLNLIFIALIILAGAFLHKEKNSALVLGFILSLMGLLISWFLMIPNFGEKGPNLFVWLSLNVPFFTMFRNMYDKFSLTSAFYYAFTLAISLVILINKFSNKKLAITILLGLSLVVAINAYPLFMTKTEQVGVKAKVSGTFNNDFNNLVSYLNKLENPSRILWLPLNFPAYINVEDKYNPGHFYSGPSLLRLVANRQDYSGQFSFITASDITVSDKIFPMIQNKRFAEFGRIVQLLNARYVILDKQNLPDGMKPYLYNHYSEENGKFKMQTDDFVNSLVGKKLQDFGTRYTLYEINPRYNNDRIYLTNDYNVFPQKLPNVDYKKLSDSLYRFNLTDLKDTQKLVFLDSYYRDWTLYIEGPQQKAYRKSQNVPVQNFANGWEIDPNEIRRDFPDEYYTTNPDGSLNLKATLYFEPDKFNKLIRNISLASFIGLGLSQLFLFRKRHGDEA